MARLANSVDKMAQGINDLNINSRVTDEKFTRVHERIDGIQNVSEILPELKSSIAVNTFSFNKMWKIALVIISPMIAGLWLIINQINSTQTAQGKLISDAISNIGKLIN